MFSLMDWSKIPLSHRHCIKKDSVLLSSPSEALPYVNCEHADYFKAGVLQEENALLIEYITVPQMKYSIFEYLFLDTIFGCVFVYLFFL